MNLLEIIKLILQLVHKYAKKKPSGDIGAVVVDPASLCKPPEDQL